MTIFSNRYSASRMIYVWLTSILSFSRAVMIANNLLHKKREELKDKTENAKMVEKEYVLVKQATRDLAKLFRSYEADVSVL